MNQSNRTLVRINLGVIFLFIIDRCIKWIAENSLPAEGFFVIPDITGFILGRNQGIAYSIPLPQTMLVITVSVIILLLSGLLVKAYIRKEFEIIASISFIIAGAVSNLLDRLQYGYVVDMIVLTSWPVFNLADVMILAGVGWLIVRTLRSKKTI